MDCFGLPVSTVTVFVRYPLRATTSVATSPSAKCSASGDPPRSWPSRANAASDGVTLTNTSCDEAALAAVSVGSATGVWVDATGAGATAVGGATTVADGSASAIPPAVLATTMTPMM